MMGCVTMSGDCHAMRLTTRQVEVLDYMVEHLLERHTHATYTSIKEWLGIASLSMISRDLDRLEIAGYIERLPADEVSKAAWRILRTSDGQPFALANVGAAA